MKVFLQKFVLLPVLIIVLLFVAMACTAAPAPSPSPAPSPAPSPSPSPTSTPAPSPVPSPSTPAPAPTTAPFTVSISSKSDLEDYLVDAQGMTLYYFTRDVIGKSVATGAVLAAWPIFNPASFVVPSSLNAGDFGTITRDDGLKQATYQGWPLYYYAKDLGSGDTQGEGVGGVWFVIKVPFYSLMLQTNKDLGNYLVDAKGMTLYYFTRDSVGKSNASAAVLANWPIFNPATFIVPSTMSPADFSAITRDDGQKQATFKGWPLYYYVKDMVSGDTLGQGVNGVWFVINPASFNPVPSPTPTAAIPSGGVSGGGGGGGGGY